MGQKSSKTTSTTTYGKTTTTNPYASSKTDNRGTVTNLRKGTALDTIYNYVNRNADKMLDEYLNPSLSNVQNSAKVDEFTKSLNSQTRNNLENNIVNPLSKRNMIRSSQASDLYKNLAETNKDAVSSFVNELLGESQDIAAKKLNDMLKLYMLGYNVSNDTQRQSLSTSAGNATRVNTTSYPNNLGNSAEQLAMMAVSKLLGVL